MAVPDVYWRDCQMYLGAGSLRLSRVCRTLAVRCGRVRAGRVVVSISLPTIAAVDVFRWPLSAPVLVLELARSPKEFRRIALGMGFWEDNLGVK